MDYVIDRMSRGFISGDDTGENISYYLYIGVWYRTLSPNSMWSDGHTYVIRVWSDGHVGGNWGDQDDGGVQFIFCLYFIIL